MLNGILSRTRRNHALEHATINLLSRRHPGAHLVGVSGPLGFTLYSNLGAETVIPATRTALTALQSGNSDLAVHENCGTNLVISAALTTLATLLGLRYSPVASGSVQSRRRAWGNFLERLPQVILLNAMALTTAVPVARWVQANVTTDPAVEDLEIASVFTDYHGTIGRIRVHTRVRRQDQDAPSCSGPAAQATNGQLVA